MKVIPKETDYQLKYILTWIMKNFLQEQKLVQKARDTMDSRNKIETKTI